MVEHIGDIIGCQPILNELANNQTDLYWVLKKNYRMILENEPLLSGFITVNCLTPWLVAKKFISSQYFYELHLPERECPRCGFRNSEKNHDPDITLQNYYFFGPLLPAFASSIGIDIPLSAQPKLYFKNKFQPTESLSKYLVIHRTSNEEDRNWNDDEWKKLIDHLIKTTEISIVDIGTAKLADHNFDQDRYLDFTNKTSLKDVAAIIREADYFIGVDSSLAHFANAFQIKSIILLGYYRLFRDYLPYTGHLTSSPDSIYHFQGPLKEMRFEEFKPKLQRFINAD